MRGMLRLVSVTLYGKSSHLFLVTSTTLSKIHSSPPHTYTHGCPKATFTQWHVKEKGRWVRTCADTLKLNKTLFLEGTNSGYGKGQDPGTLRKTNTKTDANQSVYNPYL